MFGLLDCNNFYVSCERVFNPALNGRAVVVLSNNDGYVIARSPEAKAMGIQMGTPAFQIRHLTDAGALCTFSSNYTLYGDMSRRVMSLLRQATDDMEIYSIDEAFFTVPENIDYKKFGTDIANKITKSTGIPVSVGIAATKTLAKVANHAAKKYRGYNRVCIISNDEQRMRALDITPIDEVWGIGRQHSARLRAMGIETALDFTRLPRDVVRKMMTVTGERTWRELHGRSCIGIELAPPDRRQICTSRSFGETLGTLYQLEPAVITFASRCAAKLRTGGYAAGAVTVFICTNRFRPDLPQCNPYQIAALPHPTSDTRLIVNAALGLLRKIYRPHYQYKKAGVILSDIIPTAAVPLDLFEQPDTQGVQLMSAIDDMNRRYGRGTVHLAGESLDSTWRARHEKLSPNYTTDINEIIQVKSE